MITALERQVFTGMLLAAAATVIETVAQLWISSLFFFKSDSLSPHSQEFFLWAALKQYLIHFKNTDPIPLSFIEKYGSSNCYSTHNIRYFLCVASRLLPWHDLSCLKWNILSFTTCCARAYKSWPNKRSSWKGNYISPPL